MESETSVKISQEIDGILEAVGQRDYGAFRQIMRQASNLLANLGQWSEKVASLSRDDLAAFVEQESLPEQERILRLLTGLRKSLPKFGTALVKAAQIFPPDRGGRPGSFEDREGMRRAKARILELIGAGKEPSEAIAIAADEFEVSYQTMSRIWQIREELAEPSFEEFFVGFLKSMSVGGIPVAGITQDGREQTQDFKEVKQREE